MVVQILCSSALFRPGSVFHLNVRQSLLPLLDRQPEQHCTYRLGVVFGSRRVSFKRSKMWGCQRSRCWNPHGSFSDLSSTPPSSNYTVCSTADDSGEGIGIVGREVRRAFPRATWLCLDRIQRPWHEGIPTSNKTPALRLVVFRSHSCKSLGEQAKPSDRMVIPGRKWRSGLRRTYNTGTDCTPAVLIKGSANMIILNMLPLRLAAYISVCCSYTASNRLL